MSRASVTRRLLRRLTFAEVKQINCHFELQPRKSKEVMVGQIVHQVGTGLQTLVSRKGPFSLTHWNEIGVDNGGVPRKSFEAIADEIDGCLDPVYDKLDGDISIAELRSNKSAVRTLAERLGVDRVDLDTLIRDTHGLTMLATFVTGVREAQNKKARGNPQIASTTATMRVASTREAKNSVEKLSDLWMIDYIEGAENISIAAGFYDVEFVQKLLFKHRKVKDIRLLFNGLGGRRLAAQSSELQELERTLRKESRSVEVRLAFAPGMFHSKLFLATESGITRALVGSANATSAAFRQNEEVLVALADAGALVEYFEAAWANARTLDDLDTTANSLIPFFRTGILYFKPVATLTTTLNPFRELLKLMTNEERALLGGIRLPHADQESGIGSFNLKIAVQGNSNDDESDEAAEEVDVSNRKERTRASIVPWSVETCFGYWVPSALDAAWQANLDISGNKKEERWVAFRDQLAVVPDGELVRKYNEYLNGARVALEAIPMLPNYLNELKKRKQDPFDEVVFSKFFARVMMFLQEDKRIQRLARPFISGEIPEIWDDALAYEDFRTSFFDYLFQVAQSGKSTIPAVPKSILTMLNTDESESSKQLEELFEEYLQEHGWTDNDWTRKN